MLSAVAVVMTVGRRVVVVVQVVTVVIVATAAAVVVITRRADLVAIHAGELCGAIRCARRVLVTVRRGVRGA